jgi:hypothetical protein
MRKLIIFLVTLLALAGSALGAIDDNLRYCFDWEINTNETVTGVAPGTDTTSFTTDISGGSQALHLDDGDGLKYCSECLELEDTDDWPHLTICTTLNHTADDSISNKSLLISRYGGYGFYTAQIHWQQSIMHNYSEVVFSMSGTDDTSGSRHKVYGHEAGVVEDWCVVYNSTHVTQYKDGVETGTPLAMAGFNQNAPSSSFWMGYYQGGSEDDFTGVMGDWMFWNRTLSDAEILDLHTTDYAGCDFSIACTPNWTCSGYGDCNASDLAPCNETVDENTCGEAYSGDYSEFVGQSCNYCTEDIVYQYTEWGLCIAPQSLQYRVGHYIDNNYATCCQVTSFPTDCHIDNGSYTNTTYDMACLGAYTPADMPGVATDVLGEAGIQLKVWIPLLLLGVAALVVAVAIGRFRGGEGLWQPR